MAEWRNGTFRNSEVQKLKSAVAVHRSMKHSFRAQDTPNADAELSHLNEHFGAHSVAEGMAAFRSRLPESFRKDAVQAVEYLITASPEAMQGKPKKRAGRLLQRLARVAEAASWGGKRGLRRHPPGRDDTTHVRLCGAARPETERLNAKRWLGGPRRCRTCKPTSRSRSGSSMA